LLADSKQFARFLRQLHRHDWVTYAKPALGGPSQVLRYLGRYTHRVAISNHRLLSFDGERVTFRWKDYAHGSKQRKMTLTAIEFLRRFFLHVLPKGFVRIRYFGFLANRWRTRMLTLARQLLGAAPAAHLVAAVEQLRQPSALWRCPHCGARMVILRRFSPEELRRLFFDTS
jgi:putative transposase